MPNVWLIRATVLSKSRALLVLCQLYKMWFLKINYLRRSYFDTVYIRLTVYSMLRHVEALDSGISSALLHFYVLLVSMLIVCTQLSKMGLVEKVHMRVHMGIYESPHGNT